MQTDFVSKPRRKVPQNPVYHGARNCRTDNFFIGRQFLGRENAPARKANPSFSRRYLDPKYSRWLSADPAVGDYMSQTEKGEGGIYNLANFNIYHYGGNNPLKYKDPTGMWIDNGDGTFTAQKDDTLYEKFGEDWQEKSGFDRDPRTLQVGETVGHKNEGGGTNKPSGNTGSPAPAQTAPSTQAPTQKPITQPQRQKGDVFASASVDVVPIFGFEASISLVVDLDDIWESGINVSGGFAAGGNLGAGLGVGYVARELEGTMPFGVDGNFGPVSLAGYTDEQGFAGGSISVGPGVGMSVSSQKSATLSLRMIGDGAKSAFSAARNFFTRKRK